MESKLKLSEIYDKNINFIIGSGASHGLFPILKVALKGNDNSDQTIETIANKLQNNINANTLLFMHYYKTCIEPILGFDYSKTKADKKGKPVIIIMHTEMGFGVDYMQGSYKWHGSAPNDEQLASAMAQLPATIGDY